MTTRHRVLEQAAVLVAALFINTPVGMRSDGKTIDLRSS
jgi:hypothetical protein